MDRTTVKASFLVQGDSFNPQVITERLCLQPCRCWAKNTDNKPDGFSFNTLLDGFKRLSDKELRDIFNKKESQKALKKPRPKWFSFWEVDTGYEVSRDANVQLSKLYDLLKDKVVILNELRNEHSLSYTMAVVPQIENNEKPVLNLEQYIVDFAHEIKAAISIDLYIYS